MQKDVQFGIKSGNGIKSGKIIIMYIRRKTGASASN